MKTNSKLLLITAVMLIAGLMPSRVHAAGVSHESARLIAAHSSNAGIDARAEALRNVFKKHNSPLDVESEHFIRYADAYGVDWKLLPAISGLESSFGVHLLSGSHNAYGWGGGTIYFKTWEDGIATIDQALRENYINRGATDVWSIGPIYAESPTWAVRVDRFMNEINEEYLRLSTFNSAPNI